MAKDYVFYKDIERKVNEPREYDHVIEGHYANTAEKLREIGHFQHGSMERDKTNTIKKFAFYIPGILNQSSVEISFKNRDKKEGTSLAIVHTTGLIQTLNNQFVK